MNIDARIIPRPVRGVQQRLIDTTVLSAAHPSATEAKGVVYTKRWVVELLLDLAGYVPTVNLVDLIAIEPSAGDGAFLGPIIERLADSCGSQGRSLSECRDSLIAHELDESSAQNARILAAGILQGRGASRELAEFLAASWIRTGDYLFEAMSTQADFVIGNPPYVRLEDIPAQMAEVYRNSYRTMRGRADLYVAFFEAALHQLKHGGVCAFICADRWMRNQYGAELRELITSAFGVETVIEMHTADAFLDEVDAYPAITVIRRRSQGSTIVASAGPGAESVPHEVIAAAISASRQGGNSLVPGIRTARVDRWFRGSDPWPCHSPEQLALLRRLEERYQTLESNARVGIGVATGNDRVFITQDVKLVEPERLLKLAMAKDLSNGTLNWSGHYLVDPWSSDGLVDLAMFPKLRRYFETHRTILKQRHTALKNERGWYKTIDRVTHSLTARPKLYIADIGNALDPVLDTGETYPHHNLYFIQSDTWDLEVLGGLLLSAVGQFFVASYGVRMRGGYWRFQAQYLRRIRVPDPKSVTANHADRIKTAFRNRDRARASAIALEIYGLGERELETALGH